MSVYSGSSQFLYVFLATLQYLATMVAYYIVKSCVSYYTHTHTNKTKFYTGGFILDDWIFIFIYIRNEKV